MFTLKIYDRKGVELNEGDIVKVSNGKTFTFYSEVKYLRDEGVLAPFHTFSFHSFEKVDKLPEGVQNSTETRYKIWYIHNPEDDNYASNFDKYLMSWRECEIALDKSCFRITRQVSQPKLF